MRVVVVNGRGGSGKTTFETMVKKIADARDLKVEICSTINYVKQVAKSLGWDGAKAPKDRKFLSDLKDALTQWNDIPYKKVGETIKEMEEKGMDVIFIDCREPEEIARFVEDYNALTVIVQRGEVVLLGNHADDNVDNYQYDITIDNSRGLDELLQEATIFVETFVEEASDD
jgi:chloramphenicol 3-O-phosphotransferase